MTADRELELYRRVDTLLALTAKVCEDNPTMASWQILRQMALFATLLKGGESVHVCTK